MNTHQINRLSSIEEPSQDPIQVAILDYANAKIDFNQLVEKINTYRRNNCLINVRCIWCDCVMKKPYYSVDRVCDWCYKNELGKEWR